MSELWDILHKDGTKTGKTISRGKDLKEDEYHLVVHIWIINSKSQYLVQKRSPHLDWHPNIWATTGGAVLAEEDSLRAAIREVKEELGISANPQKMKCIGRITRENSLVDIWLLESDFDLNELNPNSDEVAKVDWITPKKIQLMVKGGEFFDYGKDYFNTIFKTRDSIECWILNKNNQILLLHRKKDLIDPEYWQPITGGIKKGEEPTEACLREIQEETSISLTPKDIINTNKTFEIYLNKHNLLVKKHLFITNPITNDSDIILSHEHDKYRWVNLNEVIPLLFWDSNIETFKHIKNLIPSKRIIVVGSSASGKTHLSKKLSERLKIPHIQLDALFWKSDWQESTDQEFFPKLEEKINDNTWIVDGNYNRTNHLTWTKADTVIWLDLPLYLKFWQGLIRTIKRAITQKVIWQENGNKENFRQILSKDSILIWIIKTHETCKKRYPERMKKTEYSHLKFYRLKSHREVSKFLKQL